MKLENLKHDLPETPDFIHQIIISEVDKQVNKKNTVMIRPAKRKHWSFGKFAATAACVALAVSTIVYAGASLYRIYSERNGTYGVITTIRPETDQSIILPDEISEVKIKANYIPAGMEWRDDQSHLGYIDQMGGFSFRTLLMDSSDIDADIENTDVIENETCSFGKYEGTYIRMNDLDTTGNVWYNQEFYLLCPEEYRILVIYVSNNVSKEEAYKVIENLELVETGEMIATEDEYDYWSSYVNPETEIDTSVEECSVSDDKLTVHNIGEAVTVPMNGKDDNDEWVDSSDITATVDQVQIADDFSILNEERIPEEWKSAVGSDGKLVQNELSYIKVGDGVNTIDEIVSTELENQKLVAVDVTYTNTGDVNLNHVLYNASIMTISYDTGIYTIYDYGEQPGEGYDYVNGKSVASKTNMDYFDLYEEYGNGGNYITSLVPGESVTVRMAWIVNERDLPNLYFDLSTYGNGMEFNENTRLVDIRQKDSLQR